MNLENSTFSADGQKLAINLFDVAGTNSPG
jgi:hypothetical protein